MISTGTTTVKLTPEERKERIAELRTHHQAYFDDITEPKAKFTAKMKFGSNEYTRTKFFESELASETPLYVEWVTRDYRSEDDKKLYLYEYTPDYKTQFKTEFLPGTEITMYLVPISKFKLVHDPIKSKKENVEKIESEFDFVNPEEDSPISDMTIRDLASILLVSPISRKEWLNKLIEKCQKSRFQ